MRKLFVLTVAVATAVLALMVAGCSQDQPAAPTTPPPSSGPAGKAMMPPKAAAPVPAPAVKADETKAAEPGKDAKAAEPGKDAKDAAKDAKAATPPPAKTP